MVYKGISMAKIIVAVTLLALIFGISTESIALERKLAGLGLGDKANTVLKKYGNPNRILIGDTGLPTASAGPGFPGDPNQPGATKPMPVDLSPFAGMGPGALPGLSSVGGMPGSMPMPMGAGMPGVPGATNDKDQGPEDVRWTYAMPKGPTLEVIVSDDVIAQITVSGSGKWTGAKTVKGITLGDNYKKVLMTYGYPDKQEYVGRYLRVGYLQRSNIMFTLRDSKTVVGITIGLKD